MVRTLRDLLLESVKKAGNSLFLSDAHRSLTYDTALEQIKSRAKMLLDAGATPGERVIIVDADPLETTLWLLACSLISVVFIVLHERISIGSIQHVLQDTEAIGMIDFRDDYSDVSQQYEQLNFLIRRKDFVQSPSAPLPVVDVIETDPAFIVYTSGSSGTPKGVICPHAAVLAVTTSINQYLLNVRSDKIGHLLSLSFVYGLYQIFLAMQVQASVAFIRQFQSHKELLEQLRALGITAFPAFRSALVALTRFGRADCHMEGLRYISSAGDYLPPALIEKVLDRFLGVEFFYMYGLSECARALYMPPERLMGKPASVGRPIPGTCAFVVSEEGETLAPGSIGELIVEGPNVMNGYWKAPEESAARFVRGPYGQPRLRTGDIFFVDDDGDFYFVGRKSGLIKCRGFRISPREVESSILQADPSVRECVVYGVEDELLGQAICAEVIVDDPSHTVEEIFSHCRATMDAFAVPTKIQIVDTFRTTSSGKYLRVQEIKEDRYEHTFPNVP
jgi:long-chain acyl-CoA synthetase